MSSRQLQSSNSNQHQQQNQQQQQQRQQQQQQQPSQQLSSQEGFSRNGPPTQEPFPLKIKESKQHPTLDAALSSPSGTAGDIQSNFFFQRNRELARRWHSAHRHLLVDNSSSRNTSCTSSSNNDNDDDNASSRQVPKDKPPHPTTTEFIFSAGGSGRSTDIFPSAFLFGKRGFAGISFQALRAAEANASAFCPSSAATAAAGDQATLTAPRSKKKPRRRRRRRRSRRHGPRNPHEPTAASSSSPSASPSSESEGASSDSSDSTSTSSLLRRHRRHPQHPAVESDREIQLRRKILTRFLCHPEDSELAEAAREIVRLELASGLISLETEGEEEEEVEEEEEGDHDDADADAADSSASKRRRAIDVPRLPPIGTRLLRDDSDERPLATEKPRSDRDEETMADPPPPRKESTNSKGKRGAIKGTAKTKTPREKKSRGRSENSQGDHVDRDRERDHRRGDVDGNDRPPNANRTGANIGGDDANMNADGNVNVRASVNINPPAPHNPLSFFHPKGIPLHYAFSDPRFLQQFDVQRQLALKQLQQSTNPQHSQQQMQMQQMQMQQQMRQQHNHGGNPSLPPGHRGQAFRQQQQQQQSQPQHAAQGRHHHQHHQHQQHQHQQEQQRSNAAAIAAAFRQRGAVGSKAVAEVARAASLSFPPRAAATHRHRMASPGESSAHSGNRSRGSSSRLSSREGTPNDVPPGSGHRGQGGGDSKGGGKKNQVAVAKNDDDGSDGGMVDNGSNDRHVTIAAAAANNDNNNNNNDDNNPTSSAAAASAIENLIGMKHYHLRQEALQRCAMTNPLLYERLHALEMERRMAVEEKERERERERERDDRHVRIGAAGNAPGANPSVLAGIAGGSTSAGNGYFAGMVGAAGGFRHSGFATGDGVDIAGAMATTRQRRNDGRGDGGDGEPSDTVVDCGRVGIGEADVISIADSDDEGSKDGGHRDGTETMGKSKGVPGLDVCDTEGVEDSNEKAVAADVNDRSFQDAARSTANDETAIPTELKNLNKFSPLKQSDKIKTEAEAGNASASESKTHATVTVNADSERDSGRASAEQRFSTNRPHSNSLTHGTSHASLMNSPGKRKTPESSSHMGNSIPLEQAKRAKLDTESIQKIAQQLQQQQQQHQQQEQHPRAGMDSSQPQTTLPTTLLKDQATAFAVNATTTTGTVSDTSEKAAAALADIRIDPTFVQMIVAASKESMARRNLQSTGEMSQDSLLGTFSRGLLSMDDDILKQSLEDKNDQSNRICISNIIAPGLGIPIDLFNNTDRSWEGYVHMSSDHVMQFSKHIVYQRRKSMKSAVEVACDEMKKKHTFLMNEQMTRFQLTIDSQNERIKQLEEQLENERGIHKKQMEALEELHLADTEECEKEQQLFFEKMLKAHAEEVKALKDEMKNAQNSNTELINMYVSASCDTLRLLEKDRKNNL